jgi:NAD(P)-dependent dehydrogenase (short-subunit alcohol dehydrogenase family)
MPPFIDFQQKVIVISGATGGLGRSISRLLDGLNARLLLLGRDKDKLQQLQNSLSASNHQTVLLDLDDIESIKPTLTPILQSLGAAYGFCHCAGRIFIRPLNSTKSSQIHDQLSLNLTSGLEIAKLISNRTLADPEGGSMVFLSSICADSGTPGQIAYSASKGAVNAAVRAMAIELAPRNIKVNSVSPGMILNEMTQTKSGLSAEQIANIRQQYPLPQGDEQDVARAVAFLLAPENLWISGIDLKVDGGFSAR